jgi:hypothetical protein
MRRGGREVVSASDTDRWLTSIILGVTALVGVGAWLGINPTEGPGAAGAAVAEGWRDTVDVAGRFRPSYVEHEDRPAVEAALTVLAVRAEDSGDNYTRGAFGQSWADVDRNGCDTRNDILARDLTDVTKRGRCVVLAGTLTDPYTGAVNAFAKASAGDIEIDHVVSLAEAWRSGANAWTAAQRLTLANDPRNLLATGRGVNRSKSDDDAADWQPPGGATQGCNYARAVVRVKVTYRLTVDTDERKALAGLLGRCPKEAVR